MENCITTGEMKQNVYVKGSTRTTKHKAVGAGWFALKRRKTPSTYLSSLQVPVVFFLVFFLCVCVCVVFFFAWASDIVSQASSTLPGADISPPSD